MLQSHEIRQKFIDYFVANGHTLVKSSSLVPIDDPTLLFTNAGMNQFKDVFLGIDKRDYTRAVTAQKVVRAGGKHNDLDTVGRTARHHTFFEMLGNFSFGDYFKRDAIAFAWNMVTKELGISPEHLWITVYQDDDEALNLWTEVAGVAPERILRLGEKDNFWSMGDTGPCGPCSEIHYDRGEHLKCSDDCGLGRCDCDRWLEIWNLVFMQYDRDANGTMHPLPRPSIDTGMGLERIASILQKAPSNYETDLFRPILAEIEKLTGLTYDKGSAGFPFRVIADHIRACTFLIADGILPSNEGRGYVLRRILRRAVRFGKKLGLNDPFFAGLVPVVVRLMGGHYTELVEKQDFVMQVISNEEERFFVTLTDGLRRVEEIIERIKGAGESWIDGQDAFMLYDTYGFPIDLTEDVAEEHGLKVDKDGFERMMAEQKARGRKSFRTEGAFELEKAVAYALDGQAPTVFTGYGAVSGSGRIAAILADGVPVDALENDPALLVLDETPFYAESGGQTADTGTIRTETGEFTVTGVQKVAGWIIHRGTVQGKISKGQLAEAALSAEKRAATAANHTATHLLHQGLRMVLGEHAQQKGSLVEAERLRFDFSHFAPVTAEELRRIEDIVNQRIWAVSPVTTTETDVDAAKRMGATALFGEKYGDKVRVVEVPDFSMELCGGTHVGNTGQIGLFKIISESSVGAGLRRIEAVTGLVALEMLRRAEDTLAQTAAVLKTNPAEVQERAETLLRQARETERELETLKAQLEKEKATDVLDQVRDIAGVKTLVAEIQASDMNSLRQNAELLRDKLGEAVVVLGARFEDRGGFVAFVTKSLLGKGLHAGDIVGQAAKVAGGGGGGRSDMAQAGVKDGSKLPEALAKASEVLEKTLAG
ncbi:MAG: alanine--tRNA ligase [Solirubrobacterales bacterium]